MRHMEHEFNTVHYVCNYCPNYAQSYRDDSPYLLGDLKNWFENKGDTCSHSITLDLNTTGVNV